MSEKQEERIVRSYTKVWRIQRVFYGFGEIQFPIPVSAGFLVYFTLALLMMQLLSSFLPIRPAFRYVLIPGGIAWLFDQKMIDGKNPFQFIRSILSFYYMRLTKGKQINRFKHFKAEQPIIKEEIPYRVHFKKS